MQSPTETGSKKHIVAEWLFDPGFSESLSILFITTYSKFKVLSVYSSLSKQLQAYKIIHHIPFVNEPWLDAKFSSRVNLDLNTEINVTPREFSHDADAVKNSSAFVVNPLSQSGSLHLVYGIEKFIRTMPEEIKIFLIGDESRTKLIQLYKGKELLFSNHFECKSELEMLYFMLSALKSSELKQEDCHVFLDYCHASDHGNREFLRPYFRTVQHLVPGFKNPDEAIPFLPELLFANHTASLCV